MKLVKRIILMSGLFITTMAYAENSNKHCVYSLVDQGGHTIAGSEPLEGNEILANRIIGTLSNGESLRIYVARTGSAIRATISTPTPGGVYPPPVPTFKISAVSKNAGQGDPNKLINLTFESASDPNIRSVSLTCAYTN